MTIGSLLAHPLAALGLVLLAGAVMGDLAERLRIPWITGCILAGLALGPAGAGLLEGAALGALHDLTRVALAVIAFDIGAELVLARLAASGRAILLLALAQLAVPFALVLAAECALGLGLPAALILAAVAPMTAPTTTFTVIRRRQATGPFVDRVLGILAINDAAAVLVFSVASAAALGMLAGGPAGGGIAEALGAAARVEALSLLLGLGLGGAWLLLRLMLADGRSGWEKRLLAALVGLLALGLGGAIAAGLSHLLVPLGAGVAIANGLPEEERARLRGLLRALEEPLFIVFFVLAGAQLPLGAAGHAALLAAAASYLLGRMLGKGGAILAVAALLRLDGATRRWLGLCFPAQGGLAMGSVLALKGAAASLPAEGAAVLDGVIPIVLVAVLVSQLAGPALIDLAVRRGAAPPAGDAPG